MTELEALRQRVKNQRRELRRLNKYLGPYWTGFRTGMEATRETILRGKMNDAFGHKAVFEAERK